MLVQGIVRYPPWHFGKSYKTIATIDLKPLDSPEEKILIVHRLR